MCTVSDKLKLCTCAANAERLTNYWVLYRFVKGKEEMIMGMPVMPAIIDPATDTINRKTLLELLNDGNVFDEPLYPVNKDRLQLSFETTTGRLDYGFIYKKNTWIEIEYDFFMWYTKHDQIKEGEIENPFVSTSNDTK